MYSCGRSSLSFSKLRQRGLAFSNPDLWGWMRLVFTVSGKTPIPKAPMVPKRSQPQRSQPSKEGFSVDFETVSSLIDVYTLVTMRIWPLQRPKTWIRKSSDASANSEEGRLDLDFNGTGNPALIKFYDVLGKAYDVDHPDSGQLTVASFPGTPREDTRSVLDGEAQVLGSEDEAAFLRSDSESVPSSGISDQDVDSNSDDDSGGSSMRSSERRSRQHANMRPGHETGFDRASDSNEVQAEDQGELQSSSEFTDTTSKAYDLTPLDIDSAAKEVLTSLPTSITSMKHTMDVLNFIAASPGNTVLDINEAESRFIWDTLIRHCGHFDDSHHSNSGVCSVQ